MGLKRFLPACFAAAALILPAAILGCTSSSSGGSVPAAGSTGTVALSVSDASTEDWAVVGVKLLDIALHPAAGGNPVTVLAAPATPPVVNLVQLDSISDLLAGAQVPAGTYDQAILTFAANPGDVILTAASDPSPSFTAIGAGATVQPSNIQIKDAAGMTGNLTVSTTVKLSSPLVVASGQKANLDLEFVLGHPAFIVDHVPASGGATLWTVSFAGVLRQHPVPAPEQLVMRHLYGQITQVAADGSTLTAVRVFPALPAATPETAAPTLQTVQIAADPANGTTFFDQDLGTRTTLTSFSSLAGSLPGRYLRVAARFNPDGTLVAVRLWAGNTFNDVWYSPEGHVVQVTVGDATTPYELAIETGNGSPVTVVVNNETEFYFRAPANPQADATPLAAGTGILDQQLLVRGFKVHASVTDFQSSPLVASSVDIETAAYSGYISAATATGFTYTRSFARASDDYAATLGYLPSATPNGTDGAGNPVTGFKWWNLTLADQTDAGASAVSDFTAASGGSVDFGGSVGLVKVWGDSTAAPADPALSGGWDARWVVLSPVRMPKGQVVGPFAAASSGGSFTMTVKGGDTTPVTVDLPGSALVYEIELVNGLYTLAPVDPTTAAGLQTIAACLAANAPVIAFAVPQMDGTLLAYGLYITSTGAL